MSSGTKAFAAALAFRLRPGARIATDGVYVRPRSRVARNSSKIRMRVSRSRADVSEFVASSRSSSSSISRASRRRLHLATHRKTTCRPTAELSNRIARTASRAQAISLASRRCPEQNARVVSDRSPPQPASPTARFAPKQAADQTGNRGVNFGRRYPASGGQFSTPDHTSLPDIQAIAFLQVSRPAPLAQVFQHSRSGSRRGIPRTPCSRVTSRS